MEEKVRQALCPFGVREGGQPWELATTEMGATVDEVRGLQTFHGETEDRIAVKTLTKKSGRARRCERVWRVRGRVRGSS